MRCLAKPSKFKLAVCWDTAHLARLCNLTVSNTILLLEVLWAPVLLDGLPTQEGIGLFSNDIPCVCRVARVSIGDCDYVPACP